MESETSESVRGVELLLRSAGGVLSLPYAFSVSGYVMGTFLVIIVGILSCCSAHLLLSVRTNGPTLPSYQSLIGIVTIRHHPLSLPPLSITAYNAPPACCYVV